MLCSCCIPGVEGRVECVATLEGSQMWKPKQEKGSVVECSQMGKLVWELSQGPKQLADYKWKTEAEKASWAKSSQIP